MIPVQSPCCGVTPEAIPKPIASGRAMRPTVTPAPRSAKKSPRRYPRNAATIAGTNLPTRTIKRHAYQRCKARVARDWRRRGQMPTSAEPVESLVFYFRGNRGLACSLGESLFDGAPGEHRAFHAL